MTEAATFPLRLSRGTVFATVALALAAGGHVIGGGIAPGFLPLLGLSLPVLWVSFFLTMKRRGWPTILGALVVVQAGLHAGLTVLSGSPADAGLRSVGSADGLMTAHGAMSDAVVVVPHGGMAEMALVPGLGMLAAHVIATVLTAALLAHGESLLWSLWGWLRRSILAPALVLLVIPATGRGRAWDFTSNPIPALVDRSVRRRGPPQGVVRSTVFA